MLHMILAGCLCVAGAGEVEIRMIDGAVERGLLLDLSPESFVLKTETGQRHLATEQLLRISQPVADQPMSNEDSVIVQLLDGSVVLGTAFTSTGDRAVCHIPDVGAVQIPASTVRSVRWFDSMFDTVERSNPETQQQWDELLALDSSSDMIVVRRVVERSGKPYVSLTELEGILHDITPDVVHFDLDGEKLEVHREGKVEGIIYYQSRRDPSIDPLCTVEHVSGSRIHASSVRLSGDQLHLVAVSGARFDLPIQTIRTLDFSIGKIVYLSDLDPVSVEWTPFVSTSRGRTLLERLYEPQRDRNFDGNQLALRSKGKTAVYQKGLAIHSRTLLVYRLRGSFKTFLATVGIDAGAGSQGHVQLRISGDDRLLFEDSVVGDRDPLDLNLDVSGVRRLKILVDFGDDLDIADHLNLCEARVSK